MTTDNMKKYLVPYFPYLFLFWMFTKFGAGYRVSASQNILLKLLDSLNAFGSLMSNPLPSFHPFDLLVGILGAIGIYVTVYSKKKNAKKYRKNVEYGSACWGVSREIQPYTDPVPQKNIILTQTERLTMNSRPMNPKYARNKNVLVIGGSGSGKTRFFLKPNIMQMHSSYVVTDPKGSILRECGNLLRRGVPKQKPKLDKQGKVMKNRRGETVYEVEKDKNGKVVYEPYRIKVLNTIDFSTSMHYNPLSYIRSEKDILKFVTALIANTKGEQKGGDPFWEKAEVLLYTALIGFIHYEAPDEERNLNTLVEMINAMEVREDDETFKNPVDLMFEALEEKDPNHFAVRQYKKFKLSAGKTTKSILISCGARLAPFDIQELRELISYDELELDTIGDIKTALFVIISDTDTTFNFIAALMYSQLFNLLCDRADLQYGSRLPVHVRMLLDEFSNIGQIPNFDKLIATIRSREISACVILQTQSQLKTMYKDSHETIQGNCDTVLFLGGKEKSTLKDISESLGKETIDLFNNSITKGSSPSYGQNFQKLGKELMSVDELAILDGSKCILQLRGVRPFLSNKYDITKHPNYRYLSDENPKNAFNVKKYLSTRLKLKRDDVFDVYDIKQP